MDTSPFITAALVWGAIFGAAAVVGGISPSAAVLMSVVVFSGTAQLAILKILSLPLLSIFVTSLLLNLRFLPMSMALNAKLPLPRWRRALISWTVVDSTFALAARSKWKPGGLARYLLGAWLGSYGGWIAGTLVGVLFGSVVPTDWNHTVEGFTVVLFLVLTLELCRSRRTAVAACLGGAFALAFTHVLPVGLAMVVAAVAAAALARARLRFAQ